MTTWRLRSPGEGFPAHFAQVMIEGLKRLLDDGSEGVCCIEDNLSREDAGRLIKRYVYYRWNLRHYPLFHVHSIEMGYQIRTKAKPMPDKPGLWAVWLIMRHKPDTEALEAILKS